MRRNQQRSKNQRVLAYPQALRLLRHITLNLAHFMKSLIQIRSDSRAASSLQTNTIYSTIAPLHRSCSHGHRRRAWEEMELSDDTEGCGDGAE